MQLNYQTVTIESLPDNDQPAIDDYFVIAQDHHKVTDTFTDGNYVGKKIQLSDILTFVKNNVPYIYNTVYKYNVQTYSQEIFENIAGLKFVSNYITLLKDVGNNLLNVDIVLPQELSQNSDVLFNSIITNSMTVTNLTALSTINGVASSALKLNTPMSVTVNGDVSGSFSFDGSSNVNATLSVGDNTHRHNDTTLDDISWNKILNKPSPHIDVLLSGPITGASYFDLVGMTDSSFNLVTTILPGVVDINYHTNGNYLNSVAASGTGISIIGAPSHNGVQIIKLDSGSTNIPNTLVYRNAIGSFDCYNITCNYLTGNVTGNVTGNLIGNVTGTVNGNTSGIHTGDVIGNITGNVIGNVTGNLTGTVTGNINGNVTGNVVGNVSGSAGSLATGYTISATGDISFTTGTFNGTSAVTGVATLANSGVVAGTYNNDGLNVRPFTVDAKGRITSIGAAIPITYNWSSLIGTPTTISGYGITDAYTKTYVDTLALGLKPKIQVKAATTANITLSGAQTIDDQSIVAGDRVLVMSQTASAQNGIYVANASTWTRATDADTAALLNGALVSVSAGTANANKVFYQTLTVTTLETDGINFGIFTSVGAYSPVITGAASTIVTSNLGLSKALVSDASGKVAASTVTSTELGYLTGVTSAIQTQFSNKADTTALTTHSTSVTGVHGIAGNIVGTTDSQTLTNKTINLTSNALLGTLAQFNAALTDADFSTINATEVLSNKTIISPIITSPNITGGTSKYQTFTNSNIYSPVITGGTITSSNLLNATLISPSITGGTYTNSTFNTNTFNNCTLNTAVLNSPTLYTPNIGVATGTSFNNITGLSNSLPFMDGAASAGVSTKVSREDHKHPTDTSRSPFNGPGYDQNFIIGKLDSNDSGSVTVDKTGYDASFTVREINQDQNATFNSIIGGALVNSFWKSGSFYDNGQYSYRVMNGLNGYKAIEIIDATGKIIFGDMYDNNSDSKVQINGITDLDGIRFNNYLNGCYITNYLNVDQNELILFNSYNTSSLGNIILRAPRLKLQTFNDNTVTNILNQGGWNDRIIVDENGIVFVNEQPEDDTVTTDQVKINGSIKASGFTQSIKTITDQEYNITETDYTLLASYPGSGAQSLYLPNVITSTGRIIKIKKRSNVIYNVTAPYMQSNVLFVYTGSNDVKIDDSEFAVLKIKNESITLQSDGNNWYII